jgi:HAD superfamily hydrolase (TIGR01509 family)
MDFSATRPLAPENRRYDAIFWDFDGTMARTENFHIAAWHRATGHVGIPFARHNFATAATDDDRDMLARVFQNYNLPENQGLIYKWCRAKQRILVDMLKTAPVLYPGVAETIRHLSFLGLEQAVVTNTWRENVESVLGTSQLSHYFTSVIDKEDVLHTKPEPEPYHIAMARLKVPPRRCLAIEDSPTGIKAAIKAGLFVVAIAHPHSPASRRSGNWSLGAPVITEIKEITNFLIL